MTTIEIPLRRGLVAIIDVADADLVQPHRWHAAVNDSYAARHVRAPDGHRTKQYMHSLITGWPRVDHINGEGLDNRRTNLRPATQAQNQANRRKGPGATSSRFKGVTWDKERSLWLAQIHIDGENHFLGRFADETEAGRAYDAAAVDAFGDFALINFPPREGK